MLLLAVTFALALCFPLSSSGGSSGGGGAGAPVATQTSGRQSGSVVEHQPNDGIPVKTTVSSLGGTVRPEAVAAGDAVVSKLPDASSVSQRLALLSREQRENSLIQLEAGRNLPQDFAQELKKAESLWEKGKFDSAIDMISLIEESGIHLAFGIQWKKPKAAVSANWVNVDQRIGTRTSIDEACLDFDAQNGNLFAVLRYNAGSTGYWTVNISTNKGRTWQETYQWYAVTNYEIRDVSAAVAGDFLWVGYVGAESAYKEGRLRRFSVSDGSSDISYFYKTIIAKDVPIKEVSVRSNADNYDTRVYYSAILDRSSGQTATSENAVILPVAGGAKRKTGQQQLIVSGDPAFMLQQLANNSKLRFPDRILQNFRGGGNKSRVIVNLRNPGVSSSRAVRSNFQNDAVRNEVKQQVAAAQNDVINVLDQKEVRVTNRFTYIFGFSAEVTLGGLASLANNPNVVSIEEDRIVEAHLAQGIPLMNAVAARSNHNATGMSIAICDTGIDYNHPMLGNGGFPNSKVIGGYDTGQNDTDPMDGNGHGTACAGIAAGDLGSSGDYIGGVAYGAKLYALKMTFTSTNGSAYTSDMVEAWEWCITHQNDDPNNPIMIISTSFGGDHYTSQSACDSYLSAMTTAAANAKAAGITIFVSTGNDGFCDGTGWPGCLTDVVSVGAVYDANIGRFPEVGYVGCISTLSCAGYTSGCYCSTGKCYVDETTAADQVTTYSNSASFMSLFAPSNNAYTTALGSTYRYDFGGTSAACPYAAGAGAVLQSTAKANTGAYLTPDQVKSILVNTGDSVTDAKVAVTKPRVNLGNAVANIAPEDNLVFLYASDINTASPKWVEIATGVSDASGGLDVTWNKNYTAYYVFLSYISSNSGNPVMVSRLHTGDYFDAAIQILSGYTGGGFYTSITAYQDTLICAYEHQFTSGMGVRYSISYNGGDTWNFGSFEPDSGHSYWRPDVGCPNRSQSFDRFLFQSMKRLTCKPYNTPNFTFERTDFH